MVDVCRYMHLPINGENLVQISKWDTSLSGVYTRNLGYILNFEAQNPYRWEWILVCSSTPNFTTIGATWRSSGAKSLKITRVTEIPTNAAGESYELTDYNHFVMAKGTRRMSTMKAGWQINVLFQHQKRLHRGRGHGQRCARLIQHLNPLTLICLARTLYNCLVYFPATVIVILYLYASPCTSFCHSTDHINN